MIVTGFLGYQDSPKWFNNGVGFYSTKFNSTYKKVRCYSTSSSVNNQRSTLAVSDFLTDNNLKPVFIFEDLRDVNTKDKIKDQTKGLSGVYLILNKITKDFYVGSASTDKLYARFYKHLINRTGSKIVKLAVNKYGVDNFMFIVLETFTEKTTAENNKNLLDVEDFYLKSLLPNYNILTEAGSSFGYKHTELDRIKMKTNYSEERRMFIGNLNKNKKFSDTIIERMKQSALNRNKIEFSKQALDNMKKASKAIILYNIENKTVFG
ncbi:MAG: hypothetical protein EOP34_03725, partial [Rickettsiales bacterium]